MIVIRFSSWSTTLYLPSPILKKKKSFKATLKEVMNQGLSFSCKVQAHKMVLEKWGKKFLYSH